MRGDVWPDWKDSGRRGSIVISGVVIYGTVSADDFFFTGEDEVPIFNFHAIDGRIFPFCDHDETFQFEPE